MNMKVSDNLLIKMKILKESGFELKPEFIIMDFGCGAGQVVHELRNLGYKAFGCDIKIDTQSIHDKNIIRLINFSPYKLPFEDNIFDLILNDQVFEHVQNYPEVISEINRVLKPDGCCLHIFPSRYRLIESHVYVPLSSIIKSYPWLLFWAKVGIRNEFQADLSAKETATRNHDYLRGHTNYLSKKQITKQFNGHFNDIVYCENLFLKHLKGGRYIYALSKIFPFIPSLYSTFKTRILLTKHSAERK
ncbi:hypothetical protein MNBD_GAMMA24-1919 [hydrothermal vent metagenome]|uniref:Methyltransferase type 11 domain-containing protein n=1 Tax=hydrothermal vent metagenome TaxID=652676 RepID=A0A3B1BAL7_9ZZZZ